MRQQSSGSVGPDEVLRGPVCGWSLEAARQGRAGQGVWACEGQGLKGEQWTCPPRCSGGMGEVGGEEEEAGPRRDLQCADWSPVP